MAKQNRLVGIVLSGLVWGVLVLVHVMLCVHNSHNHQLFRIIHGRFTTAFTISFCIGVGLGSVLYILGARAILYLWKVENLVQRKFSASKHRYLVIASALLTLIGFLSWKLITAILLGYRYAKWIDHLIVSSPYQFHHASFSYAWILAGLVVFEISIWYSALLTWTCVRISAFVSRKWHTQQHASSP